MITTSPSITLVGFGAFGQLLAALIAPHCPLTIHDRDPLARAAARALGYAVPAPGEIPGDIVVLAVPVQALSACLTAIAPLLRPGQVVVDVCSIKEEPARLMRRILPDTVEILGAHPMFGPRSAAAGIVGCQVVLCPIRGRRWRRLAAFLRHVLHLDVVLATPEDHDCQAALSQALIHILAHAVRPWDNRPRIRTRSYDLFAEAMAMVRDDAPEVVDAITRGNRHVAPLRQSLIDALGQGPMDRATAPCYRNSWPTGS
ncbi:Arogenate dehydrogenase [Marinibacterium anthonyi]|nr:Arogenate dehydrogenase [Marinibacterium anthonyi]